MKIPIIDFNNSVILYNNFNPIIKHINTFKLATPRKDKTLQYLKNIFMNFFKKITSFAGLIF